jgi:uncharacterized membrane protein
MSSSAVVSALDTDQAKNVGIVTIVVIVLIGLLIARLVTKMIVRAIVLIVMVVLAVVVYQQRDQVSAAAKKCDGTFFGVHVQPHNATLRKACQDASNHVSK